MTGNDLLEKLKAMTPEQLAEPVEVAVQTFTKAHPDYCAAYDFDPLFARIWCAFPEGVIISQRKK